MSPYEVGFILGRCYIQKRLSLGDMEAIPLGATGFSGDIHTARSLLCSAGFNFTRSTLDATLANFRDAGHATLLKLPRIAATDFTQAIDQSETQVSPVLEP